MFHKPILDYNGVAFILSERGRHDTDSLIMGQSGEYFNSCLKLAMTTRFNCFIKLLDSQEPIPSNTKVVVLLGSKAQRQITPNLSLNEARGYCYPSQDHKFIYISTYDPQLVWDRRQFINAENIDIDDDEEGEEDESKDKDHSPTRRKNWKYWFSKDIIKALSISREGYKPKLIETNYHTYLPSTNIINLLQAYQNEFLYFDIETNPRYNITVFSFSVNHRDIYTVPILRHDGTIAYDILETCKIFRALAMAFTRNYIVIHNCSFDLFILLWRYKIPPPNHWSRIYDTMVMQHRCCPEVEKSLGHCGSLYTHEEYHKNEIIWEPHNIQQEQQLWRYNAKDVGLLVLIHLGLQKEIKRKNIQDSIDRAHKLILPYLLQTSLGIRINDKFKSETFNELEKKKLQLQRISKLLIGYDIEKIGSWQRISKYLYEYKSLPKPPPKFKDGKLKYEELTSSATLYKLRTKFNIPFIDVVLSYRATAKSAGFLKFQGWTPLKDQYLDIANPTRFTSADSITGTNTYRNSSRMLFKFWGSNKQNVKKFLRKVCIPDKGKGLVQTDQSGAEAYVVAYLAPKGKYRLLIEKGVKLYNFVAMHIFREEWELILKRSLKPFIDAPIEKLVEIEGWYELNKLIKSSDDWPANRRFYFICKMVVLAYNYGMKGPTFQVNVLKKSEGAVIITKKQADHYLGYFGDLFPEILMWHIQTQHLLSTQNRVLSNLFGDQREFYGHWDETLFKEAYAFIPQSTVGQLTNVAIGELQEMINNNNAEIKDMEIDILANGHDAILSQCRLGCEEYVGKIQERLLGKTFLKGTPNEFTMKSESTIGPDWSFKGIEIN